MEKVKPYVDLKGTKKEQVESMFNNIAPRYDLLNRCLSFGVDRLWRKRVIRLLADLKAPTILDVATGTGDLALEACRLQPVLVQGIDISEGMLRVAREKVLKYGRQHTVQLRQGDSENLPFDTNAFDAVMVAFGVRNFGDLSRGLSEMTRVLKPGGRLVVLEFSKPHAFPFKQLYHFYFTRILPWWGGWISKNRAAYSYLPASVLAFPEGDAFMKQLAGAGLVPVKAIPQTFGIATIYVAEKNRTIIWELCR